MTSLLSLPWVGYRRKQLVCEVYLEGIRGWASGYELHIYIDDTGGCAYGERDTIRFLHRRLG
jgi:hypothetical protein